MATSPTERERLHQLGIDELRRLYDAICESFEGVRTKALALLAGEVAMITFLFSTSSSHPLAKPFIVYAVALYGIGMLLLALSFISFLSIITPVQWHHPPETVDLENMDERFGNSEKYLVYLKNEYIKSIRLASPLLATKSRRFVMTTLILAIGIFLIALLKFGGGTINI